MFRLRVVFVFLLMIAAVSSLSAGQEYTVTALGTLGGLTSIGAVLWSKVIGLQNLNALIDHSHGTLYYAYAINNSGQILGTNNIPHALLLTPIKQPSSQRSKP